MSFIERYTTRYYAYDFSYCFHHTNNLVIMGLGESLIKDRGEIKDVQFVLKDAENLKGLVKGKKKKGGLVVHKGTRLVDVTFKDGSVFEYRSNIKAKLIEINPKIMNGDVDILNRMPEEDGYLFIMDLPNNDLKFPP